MTDFTETLAAMKACRDAMAKVIMTHHARHPLHREAEWLVADIDNLTTIITGRSNDRHRAASGHGGSYNFRPRA